LETWHAVNGALPHHTTHSATLPIPLQVIFSSIPLWSALIAYFLLHEQLFGVAGWAGAALIVGAGVLSSRS